MTPQKKIVQFGAGNIGRSLVGQLFSKAGYEVVFVDAIPNVINALNTDRRYLVRVKDKVPAEIWVDNVRGIIAGEKEKIADEIATATVLGTAVGPNALPYILETLAMGLARRTTPVSIIMCENLRGMSKIARAGCLKYLPEGFDIDAVAGFVETSIGKMVPIMPEEMRRTAPLEVWAEAYNKIVADGEGFVGEPIEVPGLVKEKCFAAHVDRKLFIHNLGHATCAYHGFLAGKTTIWESIEVPAIAEATRKAMWESGRSLIGRYPEVFNEKNQGESIEDLVRRFGNQALGDTVFRVGRDLKRKLSREDRFVGAMRCDLENGVEPVETINSFLAALKFRAADELGVMFPGDLEFHAMLEKDGLEAVLKNVSGLTTPEDEPLVQMILDRYRR